MLVEAMVAILIFSLGVLSVIQLQAVSIKQASGAEFRSLAALQANDLVSRMWASDRKAATLQANFASNPAGAGYTQWLDKLKTSGLPNVSSSQGTLPTVTFISQTNTGSTDASSLATITIYWKDPGDTSTKLSYQVIAQLK